MHAKLVQLELHQMPTDLLASDQDQTVVALNLLIATINVKPAQEVNSQSMVEHANHKTSTTLVKVTNV
jgi:hypothetical protein